jgi:transcriptional regulator with PAS, ATPase and Fis domain
MADKGTIFLDEIDSFSLSMQARLLRVLQDGEFERVGDNRTIKVDIRIIAATNQDLTSLIEQGKFRKDLYYRLNIINIEVPPLRDRISDLPLLTHDLIKKHALQLGKKVYTASEDVLTQLSEYQWPGNVRELENVVERAVILAKGDVVTLQDLPEHLSIVVCRKEAEENAGAKLRAALRDSERELIERALEAANGSRNKAAHELGIDRTTLYKKMVSNGLLKLKHIPIKKD